jgi:mono/diheme cytochrome c family protein
MNKFLVFITCGMCIVLNSFTQTDELTKSIAAGKDIYIEYCALCHKADGKGKKEMVPPLVEADFLNNRQQTIHAIKFGLKGAITVNGLKYNSAMVSQGLTDEEIADVTNYIFHSWGNKLGKIVTAKEVAKVAK